MAKKESSTLLGYEDKLWLAADKLRGSMDSSEYKHVALGLIFLKYVSDAFEVRQQQIAKDEYADPEDKDEYLSENVFWIPKEARWEEIIKYTNSPEIGQVIDKAMDLIEKENPRLKNVLNKNYSRPEIDKTRLGELVTLFTNLEIGTDRAKEVDMLGRVYEYFLSKFASAEGKNGGEFYTPSCIVRTLVSMIEPYKGRIYDPCCGSGGMFVQSTKFIERHQGKVQDLAIYGQEKNPTTWKLAKMNLAIRSLNGDIGKFADDTFQNDLHKGLKADFILANPPFNISDWGQEKLLQDPRWKYGIPPKGNANMAWVEHMIDKLSINGKAAIILANGALSSDTSGEGEIRKNILEADLVDCILAMPSNLFYTVTIPCSIWIINRNKKQIGKTLFIDAREMGNMVTRKLRELSDEDINKISSTYHNFINNVNYEDIAGFCKVADISEIKENNYILTPGRYVGTKEVEDDGIPFEEKMKDLTSKLAEQMQEGAKLDEEIKKVLGAIGYGF